MAGIGLDELRAHAHPTARFAHATFEDVARPELASDLLDVDGLAFVHKARVARDHGKGAPAAEHRDDVLADAIGEELLLRIAAEIGERQHGDGAIIIEGWRSVDGRVGIRITRRTAHVVDADGPTNVLELPQAEVLKFEIELVDDLIMN